MKVSELIELLKQVPGDFDVCGTSTGRSIGVWESGYRAGNRYGYVMFDSGQIRWYTTR